MTDEPTPEAPPHAAPTQEDAQKRTYGRLARAGIIGLLIGGVVIIFSRIGH